MSKADYVKSQPQSREHFCHWPGCDKQVPPAMWGCKTHWYKLPAVLRYRIWKTYQPGQEKIMDGGIIRPSDAYLQAAQDVQEWIKFMHSKAP